MAIRLAAMLGIAMLMAVHSLAQETSQLSADQKADLLALRFMRSHQQATARKISDSRQSNDELQSLPSNCGTVHALCPVW